MTRDALSELQEAIVAGYFSSPEQRIVLAPEEVLLQQYELNHRLYYVAKGKVVGVLPDRPITLPIFEAQAGSFVGVYSFFSADHQSYSQVQAAEPTELYYYDGDPWEHMSADAEQLLTFLFHVVVMELRSRQQFAGRMAQEYQESMNKLIKTEKLATLGQLSAGLAHELNNAIGSLKSNLGQLEADVKSLLLRERSSKMQSYFLNGLDKGQQLSSSEARQARSLWPSLKGLSPLTVKRLSKAGIPPGEINSSEEATEAAALWSLGFIMHDMRIAAQQATHVIQSIKTMGISKQQWSEAVDVNQTIGEALAILQSLTKRIDLEVVLAEDLPTIPACHGELVQIWINLIKNAVESLVHHQVAQPHIKVMSTQTDSEVQVEVTDNGIGIDKAITHRIFEPSFTTKVEGLSLGLGLGLTIVQRIVSEHNGDVEVATGPGSTRFIIKIPKSLNT